VGCNFTPSTAGNQLEMWHAATFDPETIDRELGWAAGLGMNAIRVYLHDLVFDADGDAFLERIDRVLERFGTDRRVLAWDLFDEPDQIDLTTIAAGSRADKSRAATELLDVVFERDAPSA